MWSTTSFERNDRVGVFRAPNDSHSFLFSISETMRVWISRRIRLSTVTLILIYTALISVSGFTFCTLFYCRNCQKGSITKDELAASLSSTARKLGLDSYQKEEKESMPKPPDSFEINAGVAGRIHTFTGGKDCPVINSPLLEYLSPSKRNSLTVQQKTLALCNQKTFLSIDNFFTPLMSRSARKLGEGVFGEVYSAYTDEGESLAIKIMPIDGKEKINDERQKTFEEILPEMVISKELSDLGKDTSAKHYTKSFVQLKRMGICIGTYPEFLLDAWDRWDEQEESDNDRPDLFLHDQLFVLFAFENSGQSLESFVFHTQNQALSVVAQIAATLAVGEAALGFEHRDMHRGNILVQKTQIKEIVYVIDSKRYIIYSEGVKVTVIDYTLSRIQQGECVSFNDLKNLPWLFEGKAGLQHDTYLHMRNCTGNDWSKFTPKSNAYWMHYIVNRMSLKSKVRNLNRRHIYSALRPYLNKFPDFDSARHIFLELFSKPIPIMKP